METETMIQVNQLNFFCTKNKIMKKGKTLEMLMNHKKRRKNEIFEENLYTLQLQCTE